MLDVSSFLKLALDTRNVGYLFVMGTVYATASLLVSRRSYVQYRVPITNRAAVCTIISGVYTLLCEVVVSMLVRVTRARHL